MSLERRAKQRRKNRFTYALSTMGILMALILLFVYGVREFRAVEPEAPEEEPLDVSDIIKPSPLLETLQEDNSKILGIEKAVLRHAEGNTDFFGRALREDDEGVYKLEINATLPEIDREIYYYNVWLLRRLPFEYFSAGEMFTNELGEFILEFEGDPRGDYTNFKEVIITREVYGGDPGPNVHIVTGEWR